MAHNIITRMKSDNQLSSGACNTLMFVLAKSSCSYHIILISFPHILCRRPGTVSNFLLVGGHIYIARRIIYTYIHLHLMIAQLQRYCHRPLLEMLTPSPPPDLYPLPLAPLLTLAPLSLASRLLIPSTTSYDCSSTSSPAHLAPPLTRDPLGLLHPCTLQSLRSDMSIIIS